MMRSQVEQNFLFARNNLDLVRLFAAFQVVLIHALAHLKVDLPGQKLIGLLPGVPIFFFISGFLIYSSCAKSSSIILYFTNRFLRIYPALWVCLLLSVTLIASLNYLPHGFLLDSQFFLWFVAQSTFFQFFNPDFLRGFGVGVLNGSLWTIALELQFYILTPILFWLVSKNRIFFGLLLVLFLILNMTRDIMPFNGILAKLYSVSFFPWFGMFLLGAWLSTREDVIKFILRLPLLFIIILFFVVDIFCYWLGFGIGGNGINLISFLCLVLLIVKLSYTKPSMSRLLLRNNDISYGIYIYHMPIINAMIYLGLLGSLSSVLFAIFLTFVFATFSWFLIEKPILSLKKKTIRLL